MVWTDLSKYTPKEMRRPEPPKFLEKRFGAFRATLTRYPWGWVLSCAPFMFAVRVVDTQDMADAMAIADEMLLDFMNNAIKELEGIC